MPYSIWLVPGEETTDLLQMQINRLASIHKFEPFQPHVTLLSEIENPGEEQLHVLAAELDPFTVTLDQAAVGNSFYQCVYYKVLPSLELMMANQSAQRILNVHPSKPFMPHLSVMYGDHHASTRKEVAEELNTNDTLLSFRMSSIHLVNTTGNASLWKEMASFPVQIGQIS